MGVGPWLGDSVVSDRSVGLVPEVCICEFGNVSWVD